MLINTGTQERVIQESTSGAGNRQEDGSIRSDSILVTLFVNSITSGNLDLHVVTLTDEGKEDTILTFPTISAPTTNLLLKKAAISLQRFRIYATYTGAVDYEVYVRAINGGESSSRILGSSNWQTSQTNVTTSAGLLIASALTDRNGILIKNWSGSSTIFISESLAGATTAAGYPLAPKDAIAMDVAAGASVYAVSDAGTADIRIVESGG